jgi:hypothetical protein
MLTLVLRLITIAACELVKQTRDSFILLSTT